MEKYDIVVLGAGPGGYVAAIKAAQLGAKTAIIEKEYFGGVCLNVGCIPTKTLVKNAEILHEIEKASTRGIKVQKPEIDMAGTIKMKNMVVNQLTQGIRGLLMSNKVDIYNGFGKVEAENVITIEKEDNTRESISYRKLIIATGSRPTIPPILGANEEGIMTSTEILALEEIPEHLVIVGGGVIGCEFATIFKSLGSDVTIVEMLPRLVPNMDKDISNMLERKFKSMGVNLMLGSKIEEIQKEGEKYNITASKNEETKVFAGDKVLLSIGRTPNIEGLEQLELETEKSYIKVNDKLQTSAKDVYAIGDVTGKMLLAHVASAMGTTAIKNALGSEEESNLEVVPSCIYTIPEIGAVGITEEQAKEKYGEILVGKFPLMACGKAMAMGEYDGMFKIIADKETKKVVGAHLFGVNATEIVGEVAAYMQMGATLEDIGETIHAHPTISESVMEAAHEALGHCVHLPKR